MSAYFSTDPHRAWFNAYEPLLNGMGASYYSGCHASTVLHTDIRSPIATNPTWNKLDAADRQALKNDRGPLWYRLLEELKPHIVTVSVAKAHVEDITFTPLTSWRAIHLPGLAGSTDGGTTWAARSHCSSSAAQLISHSDCWRTPTSTRLVG